MNTVAARWPCAAGSRTVRTQFKIAGTYPLPWAGIIVSGSFQSLPGYLIGTQALTAGGAGAPNFTNISGLGSVWSITGTSRYTVCRAIPPRTAVSSAPSSRRD